jgi:hypothetical protein
MKFTLCNFIIVHKKVAISFIDTHYYECGLAHLVLKLRIKFETNQLVLETESETNLTKKVECVNY